MNVGWVGWMGIGMENESGSGARCEKEVEYKNRFSEPTILLSIDGGLAVYIHVYESKRVCSWTSRRDNPPVPTVQVGAIVLLKITTTHWAHVYDGINDEYLPPPMVALWLIHALCCKSQHGVVQRRALM